MKRTGLGRGLDALLPQTENYLETVVRDIAIDEIDPNTAQPRKHFDDDALKQLADSIREVGVLQPILVLEQSGRYQIIAGERRYRASRLAGLETVPCIVRDYSESQQMEATLIENMQRENLNPVEEAAAVKSLMDRCDYTQEEAAQKLGKSRPAVANLLRLLTLPVEVLEMLRKGELSAGHARALVPVEPHTRQTELARQCVLHGYSVRRLEELVAREDATVTPKLPKPRAISPEMNALQDAMRETLGVKTVLTGTEKKGKITFTYATREQLEHIYEVFTNLQRS